MQISHKLLVLGLGGVLATAAVLVGVGAWQSGNFADRTEREVLQANARTLDRTTANVTTLVRSVGDEVQRGVDRGNKASGVLLAQRGGMHLSDETVEWTAIDQVSQAKKKITLPRLYVGDAYMSQNPDFGKPTLYVDDAKALAGVEVTMFQRMDDAGSMIRVGTTVKAKSGKRAIGTYIPAVLADGKANPVIAAVMSGKTYRGVAQVVDNWFITVYDPIKDASGKVIGALFTGVPQATALENLTAAVSAGKVGANGWITVFSSAKADAGRVIASTIDGAAGNTDLASTDADGRKYVEEIVTQAPSLAEGAIWRSHFRLPGSAGAPAGPTTASVAYYKPYQWAITIAGYDADASGPVVAVRDGRDEMLMSFLLGALLLAAVGGVAAAMFARRVSRRMGGLTLALSQLANRDLTASVAVSGSDEIAVAGAELNTAIAELRTVITEVTGASREVSTAAQQVASTGGELAGSADAAATRAEQVNVAAEGVSHVVQTVAAGAEQMGASISEISSNAQDAAQAGRDGVGLTTAAAGVINELRSSTTKITDVVRLIATIAEQTNLLALNATIEAARAGETGKGFAVVANEVKELAQETARATEDVTARVAAIEGDTARAVTAIDAISARIAQVNDYQTAIAAAVEEQAATTSEMARNITEVAAGSRDIAEGINVVSGAVDGTRRSISVSHRAADELNATARRLSGLVDRFTV